MSENNILEIIQLYPRSSWTKRITDVTKKIAEKFNKIWIDLAISKKQWIFLKTYEYLGKLCSKFFIFRYFINLNTGEAVLNIIAQASGFTKLICMGWTARNPMSSPIPEHENNRFWLFRDKFVIYEAVLNIIVQAHHSRQSFFYIKV